jgi:hypothetical protein
VLFTDGWTTSWLGEGTCARSPSKERALHVVGWRPPLRPKSCARPRRRASRHRSARSEIAEAAGGRYWWPTAERLRRAFSGIADAMGHRYVLRYEPTGVAREGWHRIDARLRGVKGDVHVRRGYWLARQ